MTEQIHRTRAEIAVGAPAADVYRALTDVVNWPLLYPWIAHTEIIEQHGEEDLTRFWAVRPGAGGALRVWSSRRRLDSSRLSMEFTQQGTVGAIRQLGGEWLFIDEADGGSRVESTHWFTADGDPAATEAELDRHSSLQMRTLKAAVENREADAARVLRAERELLVDGPLEEVHRLLVETFTAGADTGPQDALVVTLGTGEQAVLVSRAPHRVVLRHLDPPAGLALYKRTWTLAPAPAGVRLTSSQLAVVDGTQAEGPQAGHPALQTWLDRQADADLRVSERVQAG